MPPLRAPRSVSSACFPHALHPWAEIVAGDLSGAQAGSLPLAILAGPLPASVNEHARIPGVAGLRCQPVGGGRSAEAVSNTLRSVTITSMRMSCGCGQMLFSAESA